MQSFSFARGNLITSARYLLVCFLMICVYTASNSAYAQAVLTEAQIQQVLQTSTVDINDRRSLEALTKVLRSLNKNDVNIRGVINTRNVSGKTMVSVFGCAGALWGRSIRIMDIHDQRVKLDENSIDKRNTLIDKEDEERRALIGSMKAQAIYREDGSAGSVLDAECKESSAVINSIFDDLYVAKKIEYDKNKIILDSRRGDALGVAQVKTQDDMPDKPISLQSSETQIADAAEVGRGKPSEEINIKPVVNQVPTATVVTNTQQTTVASTSSTSSTFGKAIENLFVWLLIMLGIGIILSIPTSLVLRWQAKIVILENLTDAGVMLASAVLVVIVMMMVGSDAGAFWQILFMLLLVLCCWWNYKVACRSNTGFFYVLVVSLARFGMSCFLLIFLVSGKKGIDSQKGSESDIQYLLRYSRDLDAESNRGRSQALWGTIFLLFTALAVNQYSFESLSKYFSRISRFISDEQYSQS